MGEGDRGWSSNSGNLRYAGNAFRVGVQSSIATASLSNEMSGFSRSIRALVPSLVSWMRIGREAVQPRELSASYLAATNPRGLALWAEERRESERSPHSRRSGRILGRNVSLGPSKFSSNRCC